MRQFFYRHGKSVVTYAGFAVFALIVLFPFYFIVVSSFTPRYEIFQIPPRYFPENPTLENYPNMINAIPFWQFYVNSLIFAIGSTVVSVLVSAMAGYALARLKFPGSSLVFLALVLSIALPQVALLVPIREIYNALRMNNTYHGLIILMSSLVTPFTVWIMVSFVNQIPVEIEEAAYIDGATIWQTIIRVVLPTMRPALATMLIINFIISWNELLYPLIFATRNDTKTLSVGLISLGREAMGTSRPWDLMSAMSVLMILPVLVLIIFGQRAIVSGLTRGAVK